MFNLFIVVGEIIFVVILIWIFINRNIIKKVIKYTWAHYAMMYGKFEEDDIDEINYDDLIEEKKDYKDYNSKTLPTFLFGKRTQEVDEFEDEDKPKSEIEVLAKLAKENPKFVEKIAEENRKKVEAEAKEDVKYNYPIKRSMAIEISKKNNTLKTDFCMNSDRKGISYLSFNDYKTDLVTLNNKKYWQFQVYSGDISWISNEKNETIYNDGWLSDNDLNFLRCLVDTETGNYIYYPKVKKYKERTVKYEDVINGVVRINEQPPEWLSRLEKDVF